MLWSFVLKTLKSNLYLCFIVLQVLLCQHCYGQNNDTDSLFNLFRKDILIELELHKGVVVWDDDTRESYYSLLSSQPIDLLIKYTDDSIPVVRAEIFAGLVHKNADEKILNKVLYKHLSDSAKFTLRSADLVISWSVNNYLQTLVSSNAENKAREVDFKARIDDMRRKNHIIIPGARHGVIAKDSLLRVDRLTCSLNWAKIISFTFNTEGKSITSGNVFNKRIKRHIRKMRSGERIFIEDIKVEGPDKTPRFLRSVSLKIK